MPLHDPPGGLPGPQRPSSLLSGWKSPEASQSSPVEIATSIESIIRDKAQVQIFPCAGAQQLIVCIKMCHSGHGRIRDMTVERFGQRCEEDASELLRSLARAKLPFGEVYLDGLSTEQAEKYRSVAEILKIPPNGEKKVFGIATRRIAELQRDPLNNSTQIESLQRGLQMYRNVFAERNKFEEPFKKRPFLRVARKEGIIVHGFESADLHTSSIAEATSHPDNVTVELMKQVVREHTGTSDYFGPMNTGLELIRARDQHFLRDILPREAPLCVVAVGLSHKFLPHLQAMNIEPGQPKRALIELTPLCVGKFISS